MEVVVEREREEGGRERQRAGVGEEGVKGEGRRGDGRLARQVPGSGRAVR